MKDLLIKVQGVIEDLIGTVTVDGVTSPRSFDDPAGGQSALRYYQGSLPGKRDSVTQEQDFPFCLIKPGGFTLDRTGRNQKIEIVFGLYESGDTAVGLTMIDGFLQFLVPAPQQIFTAYKLIGEFTGSMVIDNHPYYQMTLTGEFRKAKL